MTHEEAMRKVMSCLRLAKSANAAEATLAAAKAQEIMTRYQLDINALDYDAQDKAKDNEPVNDFGSDPVDRASKGERGWALRLCSSLASINGCFMYQRTNVDGKGSKDLCVVGRPSDVQAVRYLYSFFKRQIQELRELNCMGHSGTYKNEYCNGVVDTLGRRLEEQKRQTTQDIRAEHSANPNALMRVNTAIEKQNKRYAAVQQYVQSNMRFAKGSASGYTRGGTGGRAHGQRDGHNVHLTSAKTGIGSRKMALSA